MADDPKDTKSGPQNGAPTPTTALAPARDALVELSKAGEVIKVGYDTFNGFLALQRVGGMFAASSIVPDQYKPGPKVSQQQALANCCIATNMAIRLGADVLMVMQNGYNVHGKWGWSAMFLIATFNQCGRFQAIRYKPVGKLGQDSYGLIAWTRELDENKKPVGDPIEGPAVTLEMAKAEGWWQNKKWQNMPDLMLRYRSAAFLIKTTAPEIAMGLQTVEELEDIGGGSTDTFSAPPPTEVAVNVPVAAVPSPNASPAETTSVLAQAQAALRSETTPEATPAPETPRQREPGED